MVSVNKNIISAVVERVRKSARISSADGIETLTFTAMGTQCWVSVSSAPAGSGAKFMGRLLDWVAEFEARYSRFIPESLIGQINSAAGREWVEVDEETERIFELCNQLHFYTRGAFDPTSLPLIKLWDWKAKPPVAPDAAVVEAARELVGWRKVQRKKGAIFLPRPGMCIDLGGVGKEYAVDLALQMAQQDGIQNVLVDFGHDVRVHGKPSNKPAWHIGLEDPTQPGKCWAGIGINDHAVATSGDYIRNFEINGRRYGHILDPRSGYPVDNQCRSVTVIAPSCTVAGILSTTAFVLGAKDGLAMIQAYFGAEGCVITNNERYHTTKFYEYVVS